MSKVVYTLKKKRDTNELHLFPGEMKNQDACTSQLKSICEKMTSSESVANRFTCYDEDAARIECAKIGRSVCGICISSLYASY
jgi:hypothetical protein